MAALHSLPLSLFSSTHSSPSCFSPSSSRLLKNPSRVLVRASKDKHKSRTHVAQSPSTNSPALQSSLSSPGLLEWMREQGLSYSKVVLRDRPSNAPKTNDDDPVRFVAASEELQPGELALRIPFSLIVTLERVLGNESLAELLATNKLSELACLALYLMYEKKRGVSSFWFPFIQELDRVRGRGQMAVESPLLWEEHEVEKYFQGSPMKDVIAQRLEGMKREYEALDTVWFMAGSLFQEYPYDIPTEAFSFDIFKQAFIAVQACVVHLQGVALSRRFALIPLGPPLLSYKSNCHAMLKAAKYEGDEEREGECVKGEFVEVRVDRHVKEGEPLVVWCGPQPNTRLLLNYGIVDEDNPYDRMEIEISLDMGDPLYPKKKAIVQKHDFVKNQKFQLFNGREAATIAELMPYMRLGHVSDERELESVQFAQGPVCGVSPCNERAVYDHLHRYFEHRLSEYPTTIVEDEKVISDPGADPKLKVATRLVRIEKEILGNALAVVIESIDKLPEGAKTIACEGKHLPKIK